MKTCKKKRLQELRLLENKLKSLNKIRENNTELFINGRHIFSNIPNDVINFLCETGEIDTNVFNPKNKTISVNNYWELLDTIKILLRIIEFDLINSSIEINLRPNQSLLYHQ